MALFSSKPKNILKSTNVHLLCNTFHEVNTINEWEKEIEKDKAVRFECLFLTF